MVRQKTISLDEKTAIIAGRMPNFSLFVRERLIDYARNASNDTDFAGVQHIAPITARVWGPNRDQCNPRHKKGVCPNCYPDGVDA